MNTIKLWLACAMSVLLSVQGCPPLKFDLDFNLHAFSQPLVDPEESIVPEEFIGSYAECPEPTDLEKEPEKTIPGEPVDSIVSSEVAQSKQYIHVGRAGGKFPKGFLRVVWVEVPQNSKAAISCTDNVFFVKKVDDRYIAHFPIVKGELLSGEAWDMKQCEGFLMGEIRVTDGSLEILFLDGIQLDAWIELNQINVKTKDGFKLTSNTAENLSELISTAGDTLFVRDLSRFKRIE